MDAVQEDDVASQSSSSEDEDGNLKRPNESYTDRLNRKEETRRQRSERKSKERIRNLGPRKFDRGDGMFEEADDPAKFLNGDQTEEKDGGVLKKLVTAGREHSFDRPKELAQADVHWRLWRLSDEGSDEPAEGDAPLSEAFDGAPARLIVDEDWDGLPTAGATVALCSMVEDEQASFILSGPKYTSGVRNGPFAKGVEEEEEEKGTGSGASSRLLLELRLGHFRQARSEYQYQTVQQKVEAMEELKAKGTDLFRSGHYKRAAQRYNAACGLVSTGKWYDASEDVKELVPFSTEDKGKVDACTLPCHLNAAACALKLDDPHTALKAAQAALNVDGSSVKGLYRRGMAREALGDWDEAEVDFEKAMAIDPENKPVAKLLKTLKAKQKKERQKSQKKYSAMFGAGAEED